MRARLSSETTLAPSGGWGPRPGARSPTAPGSPPGFDDRERERGGQHERRGRDGGEQEVAGGGRVVSGSGGDRVLDCSVDGGDADDDGGYAEDELGEHPVVAHEPPFGGESEE